MMPPEAAAVVELDRVTKIYDGGVAVTALKGISLKVPRQRFTMIIGPSGSGKTTLLNIIGCIDAPTGGSVRIRGEDVAQWSDNAISDFRAQHIGFIFQNFNLIPVLSAFENVEYPLLLVGAPAVRRRKAALEMLDAVGLADRREMRPNQLSGGQKQRVAIARALVKGPQFVLADEPTANLDSHTGATIVELMRRMQADLKTTFIFSTHDPHLMAHAEQTFLIRDGELVDSKAGAV
jgi:putative ABC transport system ATP-binding protein